MSSDQAQQSTQAERSKVIAVGKSVKQIPIDKPEDGQDPDNEDQDEDEEEEPMGQPLKDCCASCLSGIEKDPVVIITLLAFFIGVGVVLLGITWALTKRWIIWTSVLMDLLALFIFFQGELYNEISDDTPAHLKDTGSGSEAHARWMDLGWFVFSGLIMSAYSIPLLLASNGVMTIGQCWLTSVATWTTNLAIMTLCLFFAKSETRGTSSRDEDE